MNTERTFQDLSAEGQDAAINQSHRTTGEPVRYKLTDAVVRLTVDVHIAGDYAADVAHTLSANANAGLLDQAMLNLVRAHLANQADSRDWRIVAAEVTVGEVNQ